MTNLERAKACIDKEVKQWGLTTLSDIEKYWTLKYIVWGIVDLALYMLNFDDYNRFKQYIYDRYGYNVGGTTGDMLGKEGDAE